MIDDPWQNGEGDQDISLRELHEHKWTALIGEETPLIQQQPEQYYSQTYTQFAIMVLAAIFGAGAVEIGERIKNFDWSKVGNGELT